MNTGFRSFQNSGPITLLISIQHQFGRYPGSTKAGVIGSSGIKRHIKSGNFAAVTTAHIDSTVGFVFREECLGCVMAAQLIILAQLMEVACMQRIAKQK
ncbi:hypothetical protein ASD39_25325 [Sphingomonas sp. Root50]|nr:hypothetical protein ASD17_24710 [Sphingomonas sp. Root1294]KQY69665.1 hypothetical protein ASD39_25325 [Sphingomonas sp. Root50]KRB93462.1 hypothetical protein ASE22_25485 [Sphingomonas sp. Root720]